MGLLFGNFNSPSLVLRKIEECFRLSGSAKQMKIVVEKLFEATKYIAQLEELEKKGRYRGKPSAEDYTQRFVQNKDKLLMEGITRAYEAGESKASILENDKFFNEEIRAFLASLPERKN